MQRTMTAAVGFLAGAFALVVAGPVPGRQATPAKVGVKVLLPQDDATVRLGGVAVPGKGTERRLTATLAPGKASFTVTAVWEPNNYTKITRKRKVVPGDRDEVTVDLRKPDPRHPDDIVVRYVATPQDVADAMCKMAKIGPDDVVYDLGCGDGRIVITAVKKYGARRGVGIDLDPERVKDSRENAELRGVKDKVQFRQGDVLKIKDLHEATVVMLYMGADINLRLRPILKKTLRPGARVVSHRFTMGDWKPERSERVYSSAGYPCDVLLWTIKAAQE
jgi:predicted RNA methylase